MLLSIMLSLVPTHSAPILGALGRPAQAWFLQQVTRASPELGSILHDSMGPKPFTISTLLDDRGRPVPAGSWLQPTKPVWLRWTVFERSLAELMLKPKKEKGILANLPGSLELYKMNFRLEGYTLDPAQHPWAGRASYADLAQRTALPEKSHIVRMEFATPTAFRSEGVDIPLPMPGHVFRGCWQKWNAFAPKEPEDFRISSIWPEFANACIVVSELRGVNTEQWSFAEGTRGAATGFTGVVEFTLLPKKKCGEYAPYWEDSDRVLQHLAQFAFYCGIGHHATIGLGQVRSVPLPRSLKV